MTASSDTPSANTSCALFYVRDGFETQGRKRLMGRHAAGESFLKGLARHLSAERLGAVVPGPEDSAALKRQLDGWNAGFEIETLSPGDAGGLARHGVFFRPDPHIATASWARLRAAPDSWSVCGVTHTISSEGALDALADLPAAPLFEHDALICTSQAVLTAVEGVVDRMETHLASRFGGTPPPRPMLPVIPLGIHTDDFQRLPDARQIWRARMGAGEEDTVLLWFGRLSFHAKAGPHVLFRAAETASRTAPGQLHIALAGWFSDGHQERVFREGAAALCPNVKLHVFDGREPAVRREAWSAGDVFVLPVDNIQETFGLAPLEAMAAGVVPVVPAWNGFRDTIRDGETGLLIPCAAPPAGAGEALIASHENGQFDYDRYIAAAAQSVWVDEAALADAILRLASDTGLRVRLSQAGQAHARSQFDWSVIIPQYQALWAEQNARRAKVAGRHTPAPEPGWANPRRPDPFAMFAHYPDHKVTAQTRILLKQEITPENVRKMASLPGMLPIPESLLGLRELMTLVSPLSAGPQSWDAVLARIPAGRRVKAARTLFWLAKLGWLEFEGMARQDRDGSPLP